MDKLYNCYKCKEKKTIEHFWSDKSRSSGVSSSCRPCHYKYKHELRVAKQLQRDPSYTPGKRGRKAKSIEEKKAKKRISDARFEKTNKSRRLAQRLRGRLKKVMNHHIAHKTTLGKFIDWAGCSGPELLKHFESTWYNHPITNEAMSWDNYGFGNGKWTIEHIRPVIDFIRKNEELRKANHFTNLRAMWFEENIAKSIKDRKGVDF